MFACNILCFANVLAAANDPQSDHAFHPSRDVASTTEKHGPIGGFCVSGGRKCRVDSGPEWAGCTEYTDLLPPGSASSKTLCEVFARGSAASGETNANPNRIAASSVAWLSASRQWGGKVVTKLVGAITLGRVVTNQSTGEQK